MLFSFFQQESRALHALEAVCVVYVDECRFSRQAPVLYAWQAPVCLPVERGSGDHTVFGLWQAKAPGQP